MNTLRRRWKEGALGLLVTAVLYACTVSGDGYVGGYYDPPGYEYGTWGHGYYVAPPRGGDHREHREEPARVPQPHVYRPAPPSRPAPSIPNHPHGR